MKEGTCPGCGAKKDRASGAFKEHIRTCPEYAQKFGIQNPISV